MSTTSNLEEEADANLQQLSGSAQQTNPISIPHTETNICQLNDDCLIYILKYLDIGNQINFASSSDRFHHAFILSSQLNYKEFACYKFKHLRTEELKGLLSIVGKRIQVITDCTGNDSTFELLCTFAPNVTKVVDPRGNQLNQLVNSMQLITELYVPKSSSIFDRDILTLKKLPQLKKLTIHNISFSGRYFSELKKLQFLDLSGCRSVETRYLIEMLKALVDLRTLNVKRCGGINVAVCKQMVQSSTKLESLTIDPRGSGFEIIARLPSIEFLSFSMNHMREPTAENVAKIFKEMANHSDQLEHLKLVGQKAVTSLPDMLGCLKNLKVIHCDICQQYDIEDNIRIDDEWLKCFSKMENLEKLTIICDQSTIKDGLLHLLTNCKRLSHVEIESHEVHLINADFVHKAISILRNTMPGRALPVTLILGDVYEIKTDPEYDEAVKDGIIKIVFENSHYCNFYDSNSCYGSDSSE